MEELNVNDFLVFKKDGEEGPLTLVGGRSEALIIHATRVQKVSEGSFENLFLIIVNSSENISSVRRSFSFNVPNSHKSDWIDREADLSVRLLQSSEQRPEKANRKGSLLAACSSCQRPNVAGLVDKTHGKADSVRLWFGVQRRAVDGEAPPRQDHRKNLSFKTKE